MKSSFSDRCINANPHSSIYLVSTDMLQSQHCGGETAQSPLTKAFLAVLAQSLQNGHVEGCRMTAGPGSHSTAMPHDSPFTFHVLQPELLFKYGLLQTNLGELISWCIRMRRGSLTSQTQLSGHCTDPLLPSLYSFLIMIRVKPRVSHMLGTCFTTKPHTSSALIDLFQESI